MPIAAIGFSGQMHGSTLLDGKGDVVRPALLWCDQRTDAQCREITETIGAARLIELTLNPALTGFTLPKLLWVREQRASALGNASDRCCCPRTTCASA